MLRFATRHPRRVMARLVTPQVQVTFGLMVTGLGEAATMSGRKGRGGDLRDEVLSGSQEVGGRKVAVMFLFAAIGDSYL